MRLWVDRRCDKQGTGSFERQAENTAGVSENGYGRPAAALSAEGGETRHVATSSMDSCPSFKQ